MLNLFLIEKFARKTKIAPFNIIREYMEMEVLHYLSQSDLSNRVIFYGGTALRLGYNSLRFSEDLDFLYIHYNKQDEKKLHAILQNTVQNNPSVKLEDIHEKRYTLFGLLHIHHPILKHPIRLKIEISKRKNGIHFDNKLLTSPLSTLQPIIRSATLDSMLKTKMMSIQNRDQIRDWFDFWYLNQKLQSELKPKKKFPFDIKEFQNELRRWLPQDKWKIIPTIHRYYVKD
jgi:predicted nucleotidyltransferase component of viral defense system